MEIVPNTQPYPVRIQKLAPIGSDPPYGLLKEQDEVRLRWREQIERGWQEGRPDVCWTATRRFLVLGLRPANVAARHRPPAWSCTILPVILLTIIAVLHGARDVARLLKEIG